VKQQGRSPPPRSLAQREDALRRANAVRRRRAQLKGDLSAGRYAIGELLADPPAFVQTSRVADLLLALPKYGPVKVNKPLARCRFASAKTIGGLSPRQRDELAALLIGSGKGTGGRALPRSGRSKLRADCSPDKSRCRCWHRADGCWSRCDLQR
jgi:hypothetical protein